MNAPNGQSKNNGQNGGGGKGPGRRRNRKRRNKGKAVTEYWGDTSKLPEPTSDIRITDDPAAVVRSPGRPPRPGQDPGGEADSAAAHGRPAGRVGKATL